MDVSHKSTISNFFKKERVTSESDKDSSLNSLKPSAFSISAVKDPKLEFVARIRIGEGELFSDEQEKMLITTIKTRNSCKMTLIPFTIVILKK
jgi:hypothetical protein